MWILIFLIIILILIVIAITRWKIHPFLALLLAAVSIGLLAGFDLTSIIDNLTQGFGATLKSIGIVIAFGTIIGTFDLKREMMIAGFLNILKVTMRCTQMFGLKLHFLRVKTKFICFLEMILLGILAITTKFLAGMNK